MGRAGPAVRRREEQAFMFRHGELSTETDVKPFVFTLVGFIASLAATLLLFMLGGGQGLAVFAGILTAIVTLAAAGVLFALVTDRAYIEGDTLHMSYLFRRSAAPIESIGKLTLKDGVYSVYDRRGDLLGTMNAQLTGMDRLILALDRRGVYVV